MTDGDGGMWTNGEPSTAPAWTTWERALRWTLIACAASFVFEVVVYALWAWDGPPASRGFAVNSLAKDMTFLVIAVVVLADLRRFGRLVWLLIIGHSFIFVTLGVLLIGGHTASNFPGLPDGFDIAGIFGALSDHVLVGFLGLDQSWRIAVWFVAVPLVPVPLLICLVKARRSQFGLRYLWRHQFDVFVALTEAAIAEPRVTPAFAAQWMDAYWATFTGISRIRARVALSIVWAAPLSRKLSGLRVRAPLPLLSVADRDEFLERYLAAAIERTEKSIDKARLQVQTCVRFGVQMVHMSYYSQPQTHVDTGFRPLDRRGEPMRVGPPTPPPLGPQSLPRPLAVTELLDRDKLPKTDDVDVLIIGSGAGGSIVAHAMAQAGRHVLIVERGEHHDPSTFTEDELEMYGKLYNDGALQISADFRTQLLQGMCVGGGTVVNNAVCFDLPDDRIDAWATEYGLDRQRLKDSFKAVRALIGPVVQAGVPESAGVRAVVMATVPAGAQEPALRPVEANIGSCVGCGYCNIGCRYGSKLSMLDLVLPKAQEIARANKTRFEIMPNVRAFKINSAKLGAENVATDVICDVGQDGAKLRISARTVIVAAGAVHSSELLRESSIGGCAAGAGLCANLCTFMTGEFETEMDAYRGLQLSRYCEPADAPYIVETDFNPVVTQALAMPGWLQQHTANMNRYSHMMCVGVVVPTTPQPGNLVVPSEPSWRRRLLPRGARRFLQAIVGAEFDLQPLQSELDSLVEGMKAAGDILFKAGAKRVMPATFGYREYQRGPDGRLSPQQREDLDTLKQMRHELNLQTAHPQGGNSLIAERGVRRGVVDADLRVRDYSNLYVCDASVFPEGIGKNPQLTVMALAHYAATTTDPGGLGAKPDTLPGVR